MFPIFVLYCCDGVRLFLCWTGLLTCPLFIPQMILEWMWVVVEWYWQGQTRGLQEKPVLTPLYPPQIAPGLIWIQTWASLVRSHLLTTW
jgi:hypothetical protein